MIFLRGPHNIPYVTAGCPTVSKEVRSVCPRYWPLRLAPMSLCHPMAEPASERWLWQLSIHFKLLTPEMVHRVVIQATDRNLELIGF